VLGLFPDAEFQSGEVQLQPGDTVAVVSDGVSEARNERGDEFGRDRVVTAMRAAGAGEDAAALLDRLVAALRGFTAGAPQADDVTAVIFRYSGAPQ